MALFLSRVNYSNDDARICCFSRRSWRLDLQVQIFLEKFIEFDDITSFIKF